jgi:hypothetical protein
MRGHWPEIMYGLKLAAQGRRVRRGPCFWAFIFGVLDPTRKRDTNKPSLTQNLHFLSLTTQPSGSFIPIPLPSPLLLQQLLSPAPLALFKQSQSIISYVYQDVEGTVLAPKPALQSALS